MPGSTCVALPLVAGLAVAGALTACADEAAPGHVELAVFGGAYIEESIPASAFTDGWSVTFSKFLVTIDYNVRLADDDGVIAFSPVDPSVFDLSVPSGGVGHTFGDRQLAPGTYEDLSFEITTPRSGSSLEHNATNADIIELLRLRHSTRVVGTATRGAQSITFDWGFRIHSENRLCALSSPVDIDGNTVAVQLTFHGERLFHDSLITPMPAVTFDSIATADGADGSAPDGAITQAELVARGRWENLSELAGSMGGVAGVPCDSVNVSPAW